MIEFTLDGRSGVSPYLQVVHQVRQALRLGLLREGDQLPDGQGRRGHAGHQPQHGAQGLPRARARRAGVGPSRASAPSSPARSPNASLAAHEPLRRDLERWLGRARAAGVDDESIEALFRSAFRGEQRGVA